jgi:type I restriction enzyme M protein
MAGNSVSELTSKVWAAADAMRAEGLLITDYMEQLSLFMFLKMLQEQEDAAREQAEVFGGNGVPSLFDDDRYKWASWSKHSGKTLRDFVVHELFPYLQDRPGIVGKVFREVTLAIEDPGTLKTVVGILDSVNLTAFGFDAMGQMYEHFLRRLAEAGAAGEYFTYRHVIDFMVRMVDPDVGETIYDPAFGTCGFLTRALEYIKEKYDGGRRLRREDWEFLRTRAFFGHEVNRRTYRMGLLNMYLHGVDQPNLERIDTLGPGTHVGRTYDVVLSNPPYGGKVTRENVRSFPVPSSKSQLLFLQHIMESVAPGGRAAMISDEGLYFQGGAFARVRQRLLEDFEVRAVVSLPPGIFQPYTGVKTSVVFFWNTGHPTKEVWFYDLQVDGSSLSSARQFGPEYPNDIPDLLEKWPERAASAKSWLVPIDEIERNDWNLTASRYNPNPSEALEHEPPEVLIREIIAKEQMIQEQLEELLEIIIGEAEDAE